MNRAEWRNAVLDGNEHKCSKCGSTEHLHAHHIKRRSKHPELALVVSNGITLCRDCHAEEHEGELSSGFVRCLREGLSEKKRKRVKYVPQERHDLEIGDMNEMLFRLGWSQAYFARRVGVDEKTVGRWCLGNGNPVAEAYLNLCARLLNV